MPSIRAIVKPGLLVWARESMHFTVETAAHKIGISTERLVEWEAGHSAPTIAQLRKAAEVYKRPLAVFYLAEPPKKFDALRDFRRLPAAAKPVQSPDLSLAIRLARSQRELLLEVAADSGIELPGIDADLRRWRDSPREFAEGARKMLGVSLGSQYSWRQPYEALNNWVSALEGAGVLVFQTGEIELGEARGFAIYERPLPIIVVNAKDSPRGRVFTLLHEWAHILLRQSPLCDLHEDGSPSTDESRMEVFCNEVAGSILVPSAALRTEVEALDWGSGNPSESDIEMLASRFSVSREVVVRRLLATGRVPPGFYQTKRDQYLAAYRRESQPAGGFVPPATIRVRDLGKLYVRTMVTAYHQEAITSADLSNYLGMKLKHLPKVEQLVFRGA